jgi:hypothetical protein
VRCIDDPILQQVVECKSGELPLAEGNRPQRQSQTVVLRDKPLAIRAASSLILDSQTDSQEDKYVYTMIDHWGICEGESPAIFNIHGYRWTLIYDQPGDS